MKELLVASAVCSLSLGYDVLYEKETKAVLDENGALERNN